MRAMPKQEPPPGKVDPTPSTGGGPGGGPPSAPRGGSGPGRLRRLLVGAPKDLHDPDVFHRISLIAFLAWVGLGADGLSSSAYGPDESFRALGPHHYLALALAAATALTVLVI